MSGLLRLIGDCVLSVTAIERAAVMFLSDSPLDLARSYLPHSRQPTESGSYDADYAALFASRSDDHVTSPANNDYKPGFTAALMLVFTFDCAVVFILGFWLSGAFCCRIFAD